LRFSLLLCVFISSAISLHLRGLRLSRRSFGLLHSLHHHMHAYLQQKGSDEARNLERVLGNKGDKFITQDDKNYAFTINLRG
jgi:hypothetical protein